MTAPRQGEPGSERSRGPLDVDMRPAVPADVGDITRIWRQGWADAHLGHVPAALVAARTAASFAERAREQVADTIVAARGEEVLGFAMIDGDQVDQLYLDRAARGGGIGAALLKAAAEAVMAAGHQRAWLVVATGNVAARRFYERQGWVDGGPIVHRAPVPGGSVAVDGHRFVSPGR
ncbi:GNAT family N-acetyltransferase [Occultella aeris]|nr:GNAT family N-acetyltransferase [Occultella aeris]